MLLPVRELTRKRSEGEEPVYRLSGKEVSGRLDLRHYTVEVAVEIQGCTFLDEVDLRYCEFKQVVDFSECTFCENFNSGDRTEAYTIYRKDLLCNQVVFKKTATFNTLKCDGSGYFEEARFEGEEKVDFVGACFGHQLVCDGATFRGPASFSAIKCDNDGRFERARFSGEARFGEAVRREPVLL